MELHKKLERNLPVFMIIGVIAFFGVYVTVYPSISIPIGGSVYMMEQSAKPTHVDFISTNSYTPVSATVENNGHYSINLPSGVHYIVKIHFDDPNGINQVCEAGTYNIQYGPSPVNLDLKC